MRSIRVLFDDGQEITTNINGTNAEIRQYYIGQRFEFDENKPMHTAVAVEFLPDEALVGRYARSVESGWLGKIVGIDGDLFRMQGVNSLVRTMQGGDIEDAIDADDTQWFSQDDLRLIALV